MIINIHRGLEQIGGCITEISTETSRVFIDMGQNLPGNGEQTTPEQDKEMVEDIFRNNLSTPMPMRIMWDSFIMCQTMFPNILVRVVKKS